MTSNVPPCLWVKFLDKSAVEISTRECDKVNNFIEAVMCKLRLPNPVDDYTLHCTAATDSPLSPGLKLSELNTQQGLTADSPFVLKSIIETKIKELKTSDQYKILERKNNAWFVKSATDEEKYQWELLQNQFNELNSVKQQYLQTYLSNNRQDAKKSDSVRKGYRNDTAAKSQRQFLITVANHLYGRYNFPTKFDLSPTFGDVLAATGFWHEDAINRYFYKRPNTHGNYEFRDNETHWMEDVYTREAWIFMMLLHSAVNYELHESLQPREDGTIVIVTYEFLYKPRLIKSILLKSGAVSAEVEVVVKYD